MNRLFTHPPRPLSQSPSAHAQVLIELRETSQKTMTLAAVSRLYDRSGIFNWKKTLAIKELQEGALVFKDLSKDLQMDPQVQGVAKARDKIAPLHPGQILDASLKIEKAKKI